MGPIVQKSINANPRLIIYQGVFCPLPNAVQRFTLEEVNFEKQK